MTISQKETATEITPGIIKNIKSKEFNVTKIQI